MTAVASFCKICRNIWWQGNTQVREGRVALRWEVESREGLPQPHNTQPSAKQVMHNNIKDNFQTSSADRQVGPLIRTQEGAMVLGERGGAGVTPGLLLLFLFFRTALLSLNHITSNSKVIINTLMLISDNHSTESDQSDTEGPPRHQRRLPALSRSTRNSKKLPKQKTHVNCECISLNSTKMVNADFLGGNRWARPASWQMHKPDSCRGRTARQWETQISYLDLDLVDICVDI